MAEPPAESQLVSEEEIVRLIQSMAGATDAELAVGIGDDAAVLHIGGRLFCVTTDLMVEGRHFDLRYISPYDLGRRAMASNLSDLAAMGARPRWGFASLGLPRPTAAGLVQDLVRGMAELGQKHGLTIAGGDTVASESLVINLCLIGAADVGGAVLRTGARPGDAICVTGSLGGAGAGLAWLQAGRDPHDPGALGLVEAHLRPLPRVAAGLALGQSGRVRAMMDLSDGLATDLARLCRMSQVGARVEAESLPLHPDLAAAAQDLGDGDPLQWALTGGEDFELLFTCRPGDVVLLADLAAEADPGLAVTRVGEITQGHGVTLVEPDGATREITFTGFDHFREDAT